jgi:hypothetical protein
VAEIFRRNRQPLNKFTMAIAKNKAARCPYGGIKAINKQIVPTANMNAESIAGLVTFLKIFMHSLAV